MQTSSEFAFSAGLASLNREVEKYLSKPDVLDRLTVELQPIFSKIEPISYSTSISKAAILTNQALYFVLKARLPDAFASLCEAISLETNLPQANFALGCLLSHLASDSVPIAEMAFNCFQRATVASPNDAETRFHWADFLEKVGHSIDDQKILLESVLSLDPIHRDALLSLSRLEVWKKNNINQGLSYFEQVLTIDPDYLEAYNKTNFYELYLKGNFSDILASHANSLHHRRRVRSKHHQLDRLQIRMLQGIVPFIGHYGYLDSIVKYRNLGWMPDQLPVLACTKKQIVNPSLLSYWEEHIPVISTPEIVKQFEPLYKFLELDLDGIKGFRTECRGNDWALMNRAQAEWEKQSRAPLLKLRPDHLERGYHTLKSLGLKDGQWFVSVHVRDDGFKGEDSTHALRNADINTYLKAFKFITDMGGVVVRMGDPKMVPMPQMPGVIDYAHSSVKSDWMDVFLWGACRFFIGGNSGPSWIPHSFGVPVCRVNWSPLTRLQWTGSDLIIPKLFRDAKNKQMIDLAHSIDPKGSIAWTHSTDSLKSKGIEWIDNSEDELLEITQEMYQRTAGKQTYSPEEEREQAAIQDVIKRVSGDHGQGDRTPRFAKAFVHKYRDQFFKL